MVSFFDEVEFDRKFHYPKSIYTLMMMIAFNSLTREKGGSWGGDGRGGRSNKGRPNRNSDVRRGRFHRSISIRDVRCEEHEKNMDGGVGFHSTGRAF